MKEAEKDPQKHIIIKGARVHNLKNMDVAIPKNKLVVITGMSGSGKSSLAFDSPILIRPSYAGGGGGG